MPRIINIPILPLRDVVAFPGMTIPLYIGRERSIKTVEYSSEYIFLIAQKKSEEENPDFESLYKVGTISKIKQAISLQDKTVKILVEGDSLGKLLSIEEKDEILFAEVETIEKIEEKTDNSNLSALKNSLRSSFEQFSKIQKKYSSELNSFLATIEEADKLVYNIASQMDLKLEIKQEILEKQCLEKMLEKIISVIESEIEMIQAERRIRNRIKSQIENNQREYYLNEQIKAIQKELGEGEDPKEEIRNLEKKIKKTALSKEALEKSESEVKKLKTMNPLSAEASVVRNYLDFLLNLPWGKTTKVEEDLEKAKNFLNESHYGMEKAKDRIYELMIQHKRVKNISAAPVLCFHGSPGTGKTSLATAAGKAMGLKTARIALGGVRDEAEIRGHRRTYIGAMPGKILQAIKNAGSSTLLIVLDEIGGIGQDWRGNPADALLEVLDPVQNKEFQDHYLEVGFDLSKIIFMATTNTLNLPPALIDRLEIIEISGYTSEEKQKIAKDYILPKHVKDHGVDLEQIHINADNIKSIIRNYTYESGVRNLSRQLATLVRKGMRFLEENIKAKIVNITTANIQKFLGKPIFRPDIRGSEPEIGIVTGLAWVEKREGQEGEVLYIEAKVIPGGSGKIECTGRLGDVMKESAEVAFKYMLAHAEKYEIDLEFINKNNIHLHVPSGAVPKDGPSAGVGIFCAILSAVKKIPLRNDIAITGEISFWKVLPVGGIKEKILAAYRREPKIKTIFIPYENLADLEDVPKSVLSSLEIIGVKSVDEVVEKAFMINPIKVIKE